MDKRPHKRFFVAAAVGVLILIPCTYVFFLMRSLGSFSDAYASDWTSIFVIDHLRTTDSWPTGWDDLRDEYDRLADPSHYAWTFDELQSRVWLDWNADPDEVRDADPPKTIFRLTSGKQVSFNGDPNLLIREYLRTGEDPWRVDPPIRKVVIWRTECYRQVNKFQPSFSLIPFSAPFSDRCRTDGTSPQNHDHL